MSKSDNHSSEEIFEQELGATQLTKPVKWFLVLSFLVTICAIPLIQYFIELRSDRAATKSWLPKAFSVFSFADQSRELEKIGRQGGGLLNTLDLTRFINAKIMEKGARFESTIEEESWLQKVAAPSVETVLIRVLGSGSQNVYCGRDGWLFFRPTIEYLTGPGFLDPAALELRIRSAAPREPVQPDPIKAIVDFREQLAKRGIELVLLPSPAKATIYPERFSSRYEHPSVPLQNASFREFSRRLASHGVRVFDPAPLLMQAKSTQELFLKADTHWTPAGAELVARGLADYLVKNRLLPLRTPQQYVRVAGFAANNGDLAKMLKVPDAYGYAKQQVELHPVTLPGGTPWAPSRDADLLILGDSYANIFSLDGMGWGTGSGLVQQLSFFLQRPVDSILINDKGSFATRQQLGNELRRGQDRLLGKKVVVYEFATRELAIGNWKLIDLPVVKAATAPGKAAPGLTVKAVAGQQQIEGVIEEITQPPRPGSTAYKDAVIAIHLKEVTSGGKPFKSKQLVVFTWGMRDNVITAASRFRRGQRVTLKLRPWSEVEQRYGSFQRIELQNEDTVFLDIYWLMQPEDERVQAVVLAAAREASPVPLVVPPEKRPVPSPEAKAARQQPAVVAGEPLTGDPKAAFRKRLLEINKSLEEKQTRVYPGVDGWLFSKQEINHLAKGEFWGEAAQKASIAAKPESRDPLPAILDFKQQLDRAGIELIVVPVPAKAEIYPDKFIEGFPAARIDAGSRLDTVQRQFLTILEQAGVECLDLTRLFLEARKKGEPAVFLEKDTHWSPYGISLVAEALREMIARRPWYQELAKHKFIEKKEKFKLKGDLTDDARSADQELETVTLFRIQELLDGKETAALPDRSSPIVLMGDSHTLIFHAGGDMYTKGAGFPENLAYQLGLNVDLVGVRGSGATPARVELARRRDNMEGKKLVIWCFTVREYTESTTGWRKVPVVR